MYRHLLVPIDDSDLSTETVRQAVLFAGSIGAKVTFFHAKTDYGASSVGALERVMSPEAFNEQMAGDTRALLAKAEVVARAAGVVYDSLTDHIFVATGNGGFDGGSAAKNWSESVLALHPDGSGSGGKPIDSYTPTVFDSLDSADADLGSTAPAIMSAPAGVAVSRLALQIGKDAKLRLIDLADLSGQASPGHTGGELNTVVELPQGGGVLAQPAVWKNPEDGSSWVFVSSGNGMAALKVVNAGGRPSLVEQWRSAYGGTSPLIANNVVYHAASGVLLAFDAAKG